jgi:hypothetical protein
MVGYKAPSVDFSQGSGPSRYEYDVTMHAILAAGLCQQCKAARTINNISSNRPRNSKQILCARNVPSFQYYRKNFSPMQSCRVQNNSSTLVKCGGTKRRNRSSFEGFPKSGTY